MVRVVGVTLLGNLSVRGDRLLSHGSDAIEEVFFVAIEFPFPECVELFFSSPFFSIEETPGSLRPMAQYQRCRH